MLVLKFELIFNMNLKFKLIVVGFSSWLIGFSNLLIESGNPNWLEAKSPAKGGTIL